MVTSQMHTIKFTLHLNKNLILRTQRFSEYDIAWFILFIKILKRFCKKILMSKQKKTQVNSITFAVVWGSKPNTGKLLWLFHTHRRLFHSIEEKLAGFKFCSGNARFWNWYVLRKLPVSGFQQNQKQLLRPSVISRLTRKRLILAEHCSCLSSPTLSLKNKPPCQKTKS